MNSGEDLTSEIETSAPPRLRAFKFLLGLFAVMTVWGMVALVLIWWEKGSAVNYVIAANLFSFTIFTACLVGLYQLRKWGYFGMLALLTINWIIGLLIASEYYPVPLNLIFLIFIVNCTGRPRVHRQLH